MEREILEYLDGKKHLGFLMNLCVAWIMLAKLLILPTTRNKKPPRLCSATKSQNGTLPNQLLSLRLVSRFLTADSASDVSCVTGFSPWASRCGLAVGILRVHCNGMCTAQRFHIEGEEQRCRAGCQDEPDSLSHFYECPLLYNFFTSIWNTLQFCRGGAIFSTTLLPQIFCKKPPIWNSCDGRHRRLRVCPQSPPSKCG